MSSRQSISYLRNFIQCTTCGNYCSGHSGRLINGQYESPIHCEPTLVAYAQSIRPDLSVDEINEALK